MPTLHALVVLISLTLGWATFAVGGPAAGFSDPEAAQPPSPSAPPAPSTSTPVPTLADLAWLAGSWTRDQNGRRSEEHWTSADGTMMIGMARTNITRDARTVTATYEHLRIEARKGGIFYVAMPKGQAQAEFKLTSARSADRDGSIEAEAVFENPDHDFPTKIVYTRRGDALTAVISGELNGAPRSMTFEFSRGK